jgi:hypothetical protein
MLGLSQQIHKKGGNVDNLLWLQQLYICIPLAQIT